MTNQFKLRVGGVPEHFNLPWHLAIEKNAFADLGVDVEFVEYPGGTGAMTSAMNSGEIDAALLLFEGAVTNILRGHSNKIVKVYVESPLIWGIHVAADSAIQSVEEIQGKVYAISRAGSGSHLIAIVDAAERGWPVDSMKFSKVGNLSGAREKLANGKVDVFLWERYSTQPLVDSGEFRRVGQRIVPWPAFVVSVKNDVLDNNASTIRKVLEIVADECQSFANSDDAVETVSEKYDIKRADTRQWFEHVKWDGDFDRPDETIDTIVDYLNQVKIIESIDSTPADVWEEI